MQSVEYLSPREIEEGMSLLIRLSQRTGGLGDYAACALYDLGKLISDDEYDDECKVTHQGEDSLLKARFLVADQIRPEVISFVREEYTIDRMGNTSRKNPPKDRTLHL